MRNSRNNMTFEKQDIPCLFDNGYTFLPFPITHLLSPNTLPKLRQRKEWPKKVATPKQKNHAYTISMLCKINARSLSPPAFRTAPDSTTYCFRQDVPFLYLPKTISVNQIAKLDRLTASRFSKIFPLRSKNNAARGVNDHAFAATVFSCGDGLFYLLFE